MITALCTRRSLAFRHENDLLGAGIEQTRALMRPTKSLGHSSNALPPIEGGKGDQMLLRNRTPLLALFLMIVLGSSLALAQKGPVDFSLRSIDGQTVSSESLRGEVVVLAFGASWLPLSKTQLQ